MRMKKLLILSLIILSSCSNKNEFNLTASSDIDSDEMVYLVQYKENIPVLKDSSNVVEGKFTFSDSIVVPEMYYLFFKNIKGNIPVVLEPGDINLTVFKDSLRSTKITGTKSNDLISIINYINVVDSHCVDYYYWAIVIISKRS